MRIQELKQFIELNSTGIKIYPVAFPESVDNCVMIEVAGGMPTSGTLSETMLTVYARSPDISQAEQLIHEVRKTLHRVTDVELTDTQIILITAQGKTALYSGKDESERHYFQMDYTILLD